MADGLMLLLTVKLVVMLSNDDLGYRMYLLYDACKLLFYVPVWSVLPMVLPLYVLLFFLGLIYMLWY
jgi:hypothetical protein